jgi:hypothetical protein
MDRSITADHLGFAKEHVMPGKRVQLDDETWNALRLLASDSMRDFGELADEAFRICSQSTVGQSVLKRNSNAALKTRYAQRRSDARVREREVKFCAEKHGEATRPQPLHAMRHGV